MRRDVFMRRFDSVGSLSSYDASPQKAQSKGGAGSATGTPKADAGPSFFIQHL